MDAPSQALTRDLLPHVPWTYAALAERGQVPLSTLHHRAAGRPSKEAKAQGQQYLTPEEEKGFVKFLLMMTNLGHPIRVKHIPSLALSIARQRSASGSKTRPPGKNWARAFEKRHPELKARRVRAIDWKRHEDNIHDKITHWFEVIGAVLQDKTRLE